MIDYGLSGRAAAVTGAAGGIGNAIARALCREGVKTACLDIDESGAQATAADCGPNARAWQCDVTNRERVKEVFHAIDGEWGDLHILVNNAVYLAAGFLEGIQDDQWAKTADTNMKGCLYTTIEAVALMRRAGYGRIIFMGSSSGLKASAGLALYSASKYFGRGLAIAAALELGQYNITSNIICPSDVFPEGATPAGSWRNRSLLDVSLEKEGVDSIEELKETRRRRNPMKRHCTERDIANLALFLVSDQAGFINGQSIGLNGGSLPH